MLNTWKQSAINYTAEIYKYLNFDQMPDYSESMAKAKKIIPITEVAH